ncbi:MAG: oxygen-independent coproporphyrinogen III oxidase [Flavobacteriales bacterium]
MESLFRKYLTAAPRYTSYPTVPAWNHKNFDLDSYKERLKNSFMTASAHGESISLYIHLPFCESLCTYCGCNTRITKNHAVEQPYIQSLLLEWSMYLELFETTPVIGEIHLGGGTPTFFTPENLGMLIESISSSAIIAEDAQLSFEGHPGNTTLQHLKVLYEARFRRASFGIQDFSPDVQQIINRHQCVEQVETVTRQARSIGYESVNYDLVYGLPGQTVESLKNTLMEVKKLKPNRIAFYSYAHVPWLKPAQKSFSAEILPDANLKMKLYLLGKEMLKEYGYVEIGMDHFALPGDRLVRSMKEGELHRNFMGYTTSKAHVMIGLGVSSISDAWTGFAQNHKTLEAYSEALQKGELPIFRGHLHSRNDLVLRCHILNIICHFKTSWHKAHQQSDMIYEATKSWKKMEEDGLIELHPYELHVTETGRHFLRNICAALDPFLEQSAEKKNLFSSTV